MVANPWKAIGKLVVSFLLDIICIFFASSLVSGKHYIHYNEMVCIVWNSVTLIIWVCCAWNSLFDNQRSTSNFMISIGNHKGIPQLADCRVVMMIGFLYFWDIIQGYLGFYFLWKRKLVSLLHRIMIGNKLVGVFFNEMPWKDILYGIELILLRFFSMDFNDDYFSNLHGRRVHFEHVIFLVIIRVLVQYQHDNSFMRLIWNPRVTWDYNLAVQVKEANDDLLEFTPLVFQFISFGEKSPGELIEFMQYLILKYFEEITCLNTLDNNIFRRWYYKYPRLTWDPGIILGYNLDHFDDWGCHARNYRGKHNYTFFFCFEKDKLKGVQNVMSILQQGCQIVQYSGRNILGSLSTH